MKEAALEARKKLEVIQKVKNKSSAQLHIRIVHCKKSPEIGDVLQ